MGLHRAGYETSLVGVLDLEDKTKMSESTAKQYHRTRNCCCHYRGKSSDMKMEKQHRDLAEVQYDLCLTVCSDM